MCTCNTYPNHMQCAYRDYSENDYKTNAYYVYLYNLHRNFAYYDIDCN